MDGHLVENISFGPAFCEVVAKVAKVPLDVHLMISRPDKFVPRFAKLSGTSESIDSVHRAERLTSAQSIAQRKIK